MSYGLYKNIEANELSGDTGSREFIIELWKKGYSGSVEILEGADVYFEHTWEEIDSRNPFERPLNGSSLSMYFYIQNSSNLALLTEIQNADEDEFLLKKKIGSNHVWQGKVVNDLLQYEEGDYPFIGKITAKDLAYLKGQQYTLTTGYEKIIVTIADVLNTLGFGIGFRTHTNWVENNSTTTDDFLNQVYHDKFAFRKYATDSTVNDQTISKYEVLDQICRNHQLILRQVNGQWYIYQLTELEDPTSLNIFSYNSSGVQTGSTTQDITTPVDDSDLYSLPGGSNQINPAIKKATCVFDHRTGTTEQVVNATFLSTATNPALPNARFEIPFDGSGDEYIIVQGGTYGVCSRNYEFDNEEFPQSSYLLKSSQYYWIDKAQKWQEVSDITTTDESVPPGNIDTANNKIRLLSNDFRHGDIIRLESGFTTGTDADTEYYLIDVSGEVATGSNTLYYQISEEPDGTPVSLGSTSGSNKKAYRVSNRHQMTNRTAPFGGSVWWYDFSFSTSSIPADSNDDVHFYAMSSVMSPDTEDGVSDQFWEYIDLTNNWRDLTVSVRDVVTANGDSITFELEQAGDFSTELVFDPVYFGDGPLDYSRSALAITTTTTADTPTSQWDFRGGSTNSSFFKIWLKEVLNFQRGNRRTLNGELYGFYDGYQVVEYESKFFFFLGGTHTGKGNVWSGSWVEINIETGTDTFVSFIDSKNSIGSGGGSGGGTPIALEGNYLEISNNLSDVSSITSSKNNLGLGTGDSPTFAGATLTGQLTSADIIPTTDDTEFLGGTSNRWRILYATRIRTDILREADGTNVLGMTSTTRDLYGLDGSVRISFEDDITLTNGDLIIPEYIKHSGDTHTQIRFQSDDINMSAGGQNLFRIDYNASGQSQIVVNETGIDADFRVESDTDTNALFIEGSTGNVGIGTTPSHKLHVEGNIVATGSRIIDARYDSNNYMRLESNSSGGVLRGADGGTTTIFLRSYGDGYFRAGNFGLGTDSPSSPLTIDNDTATSGNTLEILGSAGNFYVDYTGRQIEFAPTTDSAIITSGSSNLEINALKTFLNQATEVEGTLRTLSSLTVDDVSTLTGNIGIGTSPSTIYGVNQLFTSTDTDVDNKFAYYIDGNFSGSDNTTGDREQGGLRIDIDSSADGDASDEHRLRGIWCDVRYTGFTDIGHSGYFYAESNNTTESTSQLYGVEAIATHDSSSSSGGVNTLAGSASRAQPDDAGSLNYVAGAINQVHALSSRGSNNFTTANPTWSELELGASFSGTISNHYGVRSTIDNNSTAGASITNSYLFYGDIQGTDPATNKYGVYISSPDRKHYFGGKVGIGTTSPGAKLQVEGDLDVRTASNRNLHIRSFPSFTHFTNQGVGLSMSRTSSDADLMAVGVVDIDKLGLFSRSGIILATGGSNAFQHTSEAVRIDGSGNVGIGNVIPDYKLHLFDDTITSSKKTLLQFDSNNIADGGGYNIDFRTSSNDTADRFISRISGQREGSGATSNLSFWTESGSALLQRMKIMANGDVGINTSNPQSKLTINNNTTDNFGIKLVRLDGANDGVDLSYTGLSAEGFLENRYPTSSGQPWGSLVFRTNQGGTQTTAMTVKADGNYLQVNNGVAFGSDTAEANRLDDYEEGSWTPTINGVSDNIDGVVYDTDVRFGRYTKIGNTVHLWGRLRTDALLWFSTSTSAIYIGGLPFNAANLIGNGTITFSGTVGYANNWDGNIPQYCILVGGSSNRLYFYYQASHQGNFAFINSADTESGSNGNDVAFQLTYKV